MMGLLASEGFLGWRRAQARLRRRIKGARPAVHYFHQVDDPYSHLVVQKLGALARHYNLQFVSHLAGPPSPAFQGDDTRFRAWALRDAASIASGFGVSFPEKANLPTTGQVRQANALLAGRLNDPAFADAAVETGELMWQGALPGAGAASEAALAVVQTGSRLRASLGHYYGGMFYFEGEWFWGLDRLHLLESRLQSEGYGAPRTVVPLPSTPAHFGDASGVTLEYFPSLRSPYTAVGHQRVADLVAASGVNLVLRPVIPMMMRGVPAPRDKKVYIMMDAAREARYFGVPFGRFTDPIGAPVLRAFAYFPAAAEQGRGMAFVGAYLSAAFARGIDVTKQAGIERVLDEAGVDASRHTPDDWQAVLDDNLVAMNEAGLWGVPSFRVTDASGAAAYACWGQDRIWRVAREIARRAVPRQGSSGSNG